jgi:hypothetical protein
MQIQSARAICAEYGVLYKFARRVSSRAFVFVYLYPPRISIFDGRTRKYRERGNHTYIFMPSTGRYLQKASVQTCVMCSFHQIDIHAPRAGNFRERHKAHFWSLPEGLEQKSRRLLKADRLNLAPCQKHTCFYSQ